MFNIKWRVVVARTLIIVLAGNPLIMAAHGIENAQLAAGQQAAMKRSANGTEVIDIVAPSEKGVSHNKFTQFNVTSDGLILNNSQGPAMSAIGGWTDGNRRLAGGTASLILAEVTSNKRSSLRGYTEVLGDSAEFVLANPNGISCNGCGFINTPRVMLATGTPDLMNGDLMGIDVTGGDVSINGAGLNASNVDKFDILTRAMRLNAALYANEINIRTGSNYYNFDTLQSRKSSNNPDSSADFEFALDASSLGAMYANRISLIGTEAGLGVRSKGLITSTDSMQLTADGQLELKNTIAGGELALRSKNADVITHGTTYGKDVSIKLADTLQNNGIIAAADSMDITAAELQQNGNLIAGLSQQGEWLAGASQQLNVSGTLVNRGRIISQGQQQVSAKQLKNTSGSVLQGNETTLNTQKLANSGVLNSNALTIKTETAQNTGHIQAQELAIDAKQFKQTQGVVYQAGPNGQLSFAGNNLQLDGGVLVADGDSQITASDSIRNKGTLLTAGDSGITTKKLQNTGGTITAGQLNVDATTVTNDSDALIEATQANLSAKSLHNSGTLLATGEQGNSLLLQTDELTNRGRIESHGENLTLSNVELDNRQGQIYQHGDGALQLDFQGELRNNGGEIYSAGQLNITGGDVDNTGGALQANAIQLNSQHNVNNSAGVINGQTVDLSSTALKNLNGVIQANGTENDSLKLSNIGQLNNDGGTIASHGRDLNLTLANLSNDNGKLLHLGEGSFTLSQDETLTNSGTIASAGNLILNAEQVNNDGSISADNNLELNATSLNNSQLLYGGNNAVVKAETITNSGTLAATHLTVSDFSTLQNSGRIESDSASYTGGTLSNLDSGVLINAGTQANALQLNVADLNNAGTVHNSSQDMSLGGSLDNSGSIIHAGTGNLVLGSDGTIHNADGSIATGGTAKIQNSVTGAGTVYAAQGMELESSNGTLVNNSQLYTEGDMQVTSGLNNQGGSLLSDGNLTINTSDNVTNTGTLQGQSLALNAGVLNNNTGVITSTGSNAAQIDAASLSNNGGVIQSTNDNFSITTRSGELDNSNGQISHNGSSLSLDSASALNQQSGVIQSTGQLVAKAQDSLNNQEGLIQANAVNVSAENIDNTSGTFQADALQLSSLKDLNNSSGVINGQTVSLRANTLKNSNGVILATGTDDDSLQLNDIGILNNDSGTIASHGRDFYLTLANLSNDNGDLLHLGEGSFTLSQDETLTNSGTIASAGNLVLNAKNVANEGTLQAQQKLQLNAGLTNQSDALLYANDIAVNAMDGDITNAGSISAANNLELNAISLNNSQLLYGGNNAAVKAEIITNSGTLAATHLTVSDFSTLQNSGRIESDSASYTGGTLSNLDSGVLINAGTEANALQLNVADLKNAGTVHNSGRDMSLGGNLDNSGSIIHAGSGELVLGNLGTIHNADGSIATGGTAKIQNSVTGAGTVYAAQGMELAANSGILVNNSQLYTEGDMQVTSGLNNQGGSLLSDGNLTINTSDNVTNTGTLQGQNLALTSGVLNNNAGVITSTGSNAAQIDTASLSNNDGVIQSTNDNFSITTRSGELDNSNGQISHDGSSLTLDSAADLNQQSGVVQSTGQLMVNALGDLNNSEGTIQASGDLILSAAELNNHKGVLAANGVMQLAGDSINNSVGIIAAGSQLEVTAGQLTNDSGALEADDIRMELSGIFSNNQGTVFATDKLNIDSATIDNSLGTLASNGELKLDIAKALTNREGLIQAGTVNVSAEDINNTSGTVQANALELSSLKDLNNSAGTINGQTVDLHAGTLKNTSGVILATGTTGDALRLNNIVLLSNNGGTIASAGNLLLNAQQVNNDGRISAENNLELNAGSLNNSQLLYGRNNAAVNAEIITNSGTLAATQLTVSDFGLLQNSGRIESDSASYTGGTLENLAGGVLINAGSGANSLQLNVAELNNAGTVHNRGQDMSLSGNLTNSGSMIHAGTGNLVLGSDGTIHNAGGSIASAGTAKIQDSVTGAGTVYAAQGMELDSSGTFVNNSQLYTKGNIQVNSGLNNQGGSLLSDGNLTINTSSNVTNSGTLQGLNLDLTAGVLNNNAGVITSTGNSNAEINAASLSNNGGVIQSTNDNFTINTRIGELDNSNGQISHNGSNLTLDSASHLNQQSGVVQSTGQLAVTAKGNFNNTGGVLTGSQYQLTSSGTLTNNNGRIVGSGSGASSMESGALLNRSGYIAANGNNLTLNTAALDNNAGSILLAGTGNLDITSSSVASDAASSRIISNGAISLNGGTELKNSGQISSAKQLSLNAKTIGNSGTLASRAGKVDIDSTGTLTNSGTVSGATAVDLDVRTLNNRNGKVQSDGTVAINVNSLNVGQIQARNITLDSNNSIALQNNESISAGGNIDLDTNANINNSGTIVASGTLTADAKELTNKASGLIRSGGNATLDANKLTNNGTVSSNSVLKLDVANTSNTGTLAAGTQLDINGNVNNSNLLFASNLLTIDGNVSNTGNIYSNRDASIAGSTVTNTGGSIAAARDLSISGKILNTYTGNFSYSSGSPTTTTEYPDGFVNVAPAYKDIDIWFGTSETRTSQVYEAELNGKEGVIAAGRNLSLSGDITNDLSTISAVGNLVLSGNSLANNSAQSRVETQVTLVEEKWVGECVGEFGRGGAREVCKHFDSGQKVSETKIDTYTEVTYIDGENYGTITAGNISGNLSGSVELNDITPAKAAGHNVNTRASGSRGSASRGSSASNNSDTKVVVLRSNGNAQDTTGAGRSGIDNDTVELDWRDNDVRPTSPKNVEVAVSLRNGNTQNTTGASRSVNGVTGIDNDTIEIDGRDNNTDVNVVVNRTDGNSQNITDAERLAGTGNAAMPADNAELIKTSSPNKLGANSSGFGVQGVGFMTPDMADSLRMSQGVAPEAPGVQQGVGTVGNGNIANESDYNPDLIIKGLVDDQKGTLAQQKESLQQQETVQQQKNAQQQVAGQRAGQNVFMTDEQMRVLTEDLGFDADAINQGQEGLYSAISQNDLLEDGVTLSATGIVDITADAGLDIDSGIAAGEGLILRSEGGLNMGDYGHFDSDNLLGLQLGGDFTNDMSLESDTLWLDIGGDFTNQGELTGNDVLSITAGDDLINQNLLSGGNVTLNAGGDIVNRTEFTQYTREDSNGNSRTYTRVGDSPEIISGESLSMNAGNDLDLQGSQLGAAGDISLHAGNDVLLNAVEKVNGHEKYFKGGYDIELDRTYDVVSLEAGGNLSVVAGNNLESEGAQFVGGGNVELAAGNEMNLLGVVEYHEDRDKRTKKSTFKKKVYIDETYSAEHHGSVVAAGGNVSLNAQQSADGLQLFNSGDVFLEGAYLQAGGDVVAYSGGQLDMVSGEEWQAENHIKKKSMFGGLFGSTKISETDVQYLGHAELNAGGDIALLAENDINVLAGRMNAENITAQAGFGNEDAQTADINILGDTETSSLYQETRRNGLALGFSDNFLSVAKETANENRITQTDYIGSAFTARDNMALSASRDVNVVGSELYAGNNLQVDAGRDINVMTGQGSGSSYSRETETKTGIAISADSNTLSVFAGDDTQKDALTSDSVTQTGSTLTAGNNVQLNAGNDLLISGSDVVAGQDANLSAANDINIVTAQELFNQETEHSSTRDGLTVSANYNVGKTVDAISNLGQGDDATSVASSVMQAADTLNNAGPSAGAHFGQTTETTTDNVQQSQAKGSSLTAGRDVTISAGGDALLEGVNADAGRDIGINAENVSVVAAQNNSDSQHNTEYLQVGLNLNASTSNVSLTAGFSQSDSELDNQNTSAVGSSLNAGGNVDINARNDLAIVGSDINGDDNVALTAGNDIVIEAAESQYSSESEDSHLSAGAGANFGSEGVGFTANMAMGEGELDREGTTYSNSHITAGNNLSVTSGNDTVIEGGNLAGTDVAMDVGGDLTLASVQDTGQVKGDRWDVSMNITVGAGASVGASVGYGETDGSSAWVNEQSSIIGSGSVDIRTEGHTQIDGAAIANIDEEGNDGGNLSLDTGTLAYSDIEDHDQEKSTYLNVGFTMGDDNSTNQTESGTNYTASGHYNNHDKEQINRATVGEGTIVVRDNTEQDTSDLNRDTELAQEVTKDDSQNTNLYASTTAVDSLTNLAENPSEQLNQWKDNVASVGSADAWGQVGENASDALEDTYNAGAAVATDKDLGVGNFWVSLDSTHKMTQLKNDLTSTAEGQALLARLTSDDPDQRLAAEAELGHRAQEKFGIDPSDIHFYQGSETSSESLTDTVLSDVKGATVTEEGHSEYGNILVNVDNATDGKDMTNTVGHEVYETVTLQTGGENDASQEAIANLVGGQLANRIDQATGGELANVGTGDLAGSNTVRQGTQHANAVGNAQVDYRQLQSKEMQAIKEMAPLMAKKEGITEEAAEKRMAEELLSHLDASWSSNFEAQGREGDETALDYLAAALVEQGSAYAEYSDSDVPESPDATPKTYTKEAVKQSLIAYKDERTSEYNDRTREGEGLTSQYSEQWQFYDKNLAADKSLSDYGDMAAGALTGLADTVENLVSPWISDPVGAAESTSMGMQQMLYDPAGTGSMIFEAKEEGQINAALDDLQGDYFSSARTGMSTDLGFALDLGLLGRLGSSTTKVRIGSFGGAPDTSTFISRSDNDFLSLTNDKGAPKAHFDQTGNLISANPEGSGSIHSHIRGGNSGNSPYISFTDPSISSNPKNYGENTVLVDINGLQKDIDSGLVTNAEIITYKEVQIELKNKLHQAKVRYEKNPTQSNLDSLDRAKKDLVNVTRDGECLIKGCVPKKYIHSPGD